MDTLATLTALSSQMTESIPLIHREIRSHLTSILSGQILATSAEVTPNGGLVRESPQNGLKLG